MIIRPKLQVGRNAKPCVLGQYPAGMTQKAGKKMLIVVGAFPKLSCYFIFWVVLISRILFFGPGYIHTYVYVCVCTERLGSLVY